MQKIHKNQNSSLILVITLFIALNGCSKRQEAADSTTADVQSVAAIPSAEQATQANHTSDVPDVLLSAQPNPAEKNRPMVKTATIDFEVKDVYQSALQLEQLTAKFAGFVEQKDIQKTLENEVSRNNGDGTQTIFQKIRPHASMIVRIPNDQTQRFINTLPQFMLFLNEQRYEAKRLQLKLLQEKLGQQATLGAVGDSRANNRLAADIADLTQQEVQDRLNYSTIQLDFSQPAMLRQTQDIQLQRVALEQYGFFNRLWHSIQLGAVGFLDFLVTAMLLWPLWLILSIAVVLIGKYKKKRRNPLAKTPENQDI